jgi:hypothetical protein
MPQIEDATVFCRIREGRDGRPLLQFGGHFLPSLPNVQFGLCLTPGTSWDQAVLLAELIDRASSKLIGRFRGVPLDLAGPKAETTQTLCRVATMPTGRRFLEFDGELPSLPGVCFGLGLSLEVSWTQAQTFAAYITDHCHKLFATFLEQRSDGPHRYLVEEDGFARGRL